jgi:hypothetical protein
MAGHSGWTVTAQVTDQVINTNAGQTVVGTYIYIVTGDGQEGSVFVPDTIYHDKAKVTAMLRTKAVQLDTVAKLAEAAG